MPRIPPIVAFAAPSGTGKTTLLEGVIRVLVGRGLRVAVLKSDAHRLILDKPGKDSYRFAEAGAVSVGVLSSERFACFERLEGEVSLVHAVGRLAPGVDVVLAEGFRSSNLPTIRVHRRDGPSAEGWAPPRNLVAWASDSPVDTALPVLPLDNPAAVADWVWTRFGAAAPPRRPTLVLPVGEPAAFAAAFAAAERLGAALAAPALVVAPPAVAAAAPPPPPGVRVVGDLRPQLGLLGALFTGLASADTPEVLLVGTRHQAAPPALLRGLLAAGSPAADLVYLLVDGRPEPALAVYGHRCLSSIQSALLSGELKLTGWWGQVRAHAVPPEAWAAWDPTRAACPPRLPS